LLKRLITGRKIIMEYCSRLYLHENGDENEEDEESKKSSPIKQKEIHSKIFQFFKSNPQPSDEKVHEFAESIGMEPDDLESHIYMILGSFLGAGESKNFKGKYDQKQLEMGIKIEMEHTTNPAISERIAKDHLAEISDYYTRLEKMEKDAGKE